jgi:hypothetical protein
MVLIANALLVACQDSSKSTKREPESPASVATKNDADKIDIPYTVAKNYFVKNTVKSLDDPKIATAKKFDEIFGMATTMGKDGKPTTIDFSKQYVLAVILPETDLLTTIEPISLQKNSNNKITLVYKSVVAQKQSYTMRPYFAIIVENTENGEIELKEQK